MKKIIAVLTFCTMITCAFASCSEEEKSESSVSESSASVSETAEESETAEDEISAEESEVSAEESAVSDDTAPAEETITGTWLVDNEKYGFTANEDGTVNLVLDVSEIVHLTSDGGLYLSGENFSADYVSYEALTLDAVINGSEVILVKDDAVDEINGRYLIVDLGDFTDDNLASLIAEMGLESYNPYIYIDGENFYLEYENIFEYTAENGNITVSEDFPAIELYKDSVITYEFTDGNHVNITADGFAVTMTRADF